MPEGRLKSRSLHRVKTRTPRGRTVTHYERRKPAKAQCSACGVYLHGVARAHASQLRNMPKSQKRPTRPFGGVLCSRCTRKAISDKFRRLYQLAPKN